MHIVTLTAHQLRKMFWTPHFFWAGDVTDDFIWLQCIIKSKDFIHFIVSFIIQTYNAKIYIFPADGLLTTVSAMQSRLFSSREIPKNRTESRKPMRIEDYEPGHSSIVSDEGLRVGSLHIVCFHLSIVEIIFQTF